MHNAAFLQTKEIRIYIFLTSLVIFGLLASLITAVKIVHFGIDFPFANLIFSIFTYPIVDCICELWGKAAARQALWMGLIFQLAFAMIIQISIIAPPASFWSLQSEYQMVLSTSTRVVIASLIAFSISQLLDIVVYQKIKELSQGKCLWLRSNVSIYLGQALDSIIFINIVFFSSQQKFNILIGSISIKVLLSLLMTPVVYFIVMTVNKYLNSNTLAFRTEPILKLN